MFCRRCGGRMSAEEWQCRSCGWTEVPAPPVQSEGSDDKGLLSIAKVIIVVAILSGVVLGAVFAWRASSEPLFDILDRECQLTGSGFTAWVTVKNIGFATGEVTVVCEVFFSDGMSFWDNETNDLGPGVEWEAVLVVELPQAYVTDESGMYTIRLEY